MSSLLRGYNYDLFSSPIGRGKKRITKKRFAELILSIQKLTMQEQKRELENYLSNYRKEVEQRDDVLVVGVKI